MSNGSESARNKGRRRRSENPEKYKEIDRRNAANPNYKVVRTRRQRMISDRAKKVRAKLDSIGYCDMAEILFGDQP